MEQVKVDVASKNDPYSVATDNQAEKIGQEKVAEIIGVVETVRKAFFFGDLGAVAVGAIGAAVGAIGALGGYLIFPNWSIKAIQWGALICASIGGTVGLISGVASGIFFGMAEKRSLIDAIYEKDYERIKEKYEHLMQENGYSDDQVFGDLKIVYGKNGSSASHYFSSDGKIIMKQILEKHVDEGRTLKEKMLRCQQIIDFFYFIKNQSTDDAQKQMFIKFVEKNICIIYLRTTQKLKVKPHPYDVVNFLKSNKTILKMKNVILKRKESIDQHVINKNWEEGIYGS